MITRNLFLHPIRTTLALLLAASAIPATAAPVLLDFDMTGRSLAEGQEPGYTEWAVTETSSAATMTQSGVTFTVARNGGAGTGIKSYYYKVGVQAPNYARLVCDALSVVGGDAGASIRVTISGMASGSHSLLVYHNAIDGNQHSNIKVVVNGTTAISSQPQTNEVLTTAAASFSYVTFSGTSVTVDYTSLGTGSYNNVFLDNLSLDVANPAMQANSPSPEDHDFHVDGDAGSITMSWKGASGAKSHDVYLGTDSSAVAKATKSSSQYQGNQTATTWTVKNVSNLKTYWWRIDEIDASGAATPSTVWAFSPRHLAFPGAEGYGRYARGGRGGKVVHVTNLNDDGAGSFRQLATDSTLGPRTIVFDVGGYITLKSRITLSDPNVTVAGQTAPGQGICIRSAPFGLSGGVDDVVRFMKVRVGYTGTTYDGMGMQGSDYSIFDHNSISWSQDEAFSSRNAKNITLQRTMISEALNEANHTNSAGAVDITHGFAATISGNTGSFHHNLLSFDEGRNWSMGAAIDGAGNFISKLDIFNNVVYGFGGRATDGQAWEVNFVGNYYKKTAATKINFTMNMQFENYGTGTLNCYFANNILQNADGSYACDGTNNTCGRQYSLSNGATAPTWNMWASKAFFPSYATVQSAKDAYKDVLSDVGMTFPVLDTHDIRNIKETYDGTVWGKGSLTGLAGLPDREADVGGYMPMSNTSRASNFDTDGDGLPDWYEAYIGTSPNSAKGDFSDANADPVGDGYTNLDRYLDYMATPHAEVASGTAATFDLAALFRGYQKTTPTYKTGSNSCLTASISGSTLKVTPNSACGIAVLPVTVTDKENATKTTNVAVFVTGSKTTGIQARVLPNFEWRVSREAIEFRTPAHGTLTLLDLSGRQVRQVAGSSELRIELANLPRGVLVGRFEGEGLHEERAIPSFR
jgi:hypothetical protein